MNGIGLICFQTQGQQIQPIHYADYACLNFCNVRWISKLLFKGPTYYLRDKIELASHNSRIDCKLELKFISCLKRSNSVEQYINEKYISYLHASDCYSVHFVDIHTELEILLPQNSVKTDTFMR